MPCVSTVAFEMENGHSKDSDQSSVHSTTHRVKIHPPWWNLNGSHVSQASHLKDAYMSMEPLAQHGNQIKQLGRQLPDQDSLSTQSTGQSHQEEPGRDKTSFHTECVSSQSGNDTSEKQIEDRMQSDLSLGSSDAVFPQKLDYNQSFQACAPYPGADPYYMGLLAAYGSQANMNPQMMGMPISARVPLPIQPALEEPIYVNAKQFHRIMQRRQLRAKLEAQNKVIKDRKPYLHESRHLHALKRARGTGGRFLNTKQLEQQSQLSAAKGSPGALGSSSQHPSVNNGSLTTPTGSEVTTVSDSGNMFQQYRRNYSSDFSSHLTGNMDSGERPTGELASMAFKL